MGTPQQGCTIDGSFFFLNREPLFFRTGFGKQTRRAELWAWSPRPPAVLLAQTQEGFSAFLEYKNVETRKAVVVDGELRFQGHLNWD